MTKNVFAQELNY